MFMFFQISSRPSNILLPNLVLWCITISGSACRKIGLLFLRSRSYQELIWSKYDSFCNICWTADSLATKLGLMAHYHKPECFMEKWDCCVQGHGHSKFTRLMNVFPMMSSESLKLLQPNLLWWSIIISKIVFQKDWFAIFKIKVTARVHMIKIWQFLSYLSNCWSFCYQTWFDSTLL